MCLEDSLGIAWTITPFDTVMTPQAAPEARTGGNSWRSQVERALVGRGDGIDTVTAINLPPIKSTVSCPSLPSCNSPFYFLPFVLPILLYPSLSLSSSLSPFSHLSFHLIRFRFLLFLVSSVAFRPHCSR